MKAHRNTSEDERLRRAAREAGLSAEKLGRLIRELVRAGHGPHPLSDELSLDIEARVRLLKRRVERRGELHDHEITGVADMFAQYVVLLEQEDYWLTGRPTQPWSRVDCVAAEESGAYEDFFWVIGASEGFDVSNDEDRDIWFIDLSEQSADYQLFHRRLYATATKLHRRWLRELGIGPLLRPQRRRRRAE